MMILDSGLFFGATLYNPIRDGNDLWCVAKSECVVI